MSGRWYAAVPRDQGRDERTREELLCTSFAVVVAAAPALRDRINGILPSKAVSLTTALADFAFSMPGSIS